MKTNLPQFNTRQIALAWTILLPLGLVIGGIAGRSLGAGQPGTQFEITAITMGESLGVVLGAVASGLLTTRVLTRAGLPTKRPYDFLVAGSWGLAFLIGLLPFVALGILMD